LSGCAAAIWKQDLQLAEVFKHGGKLLTRMGAEVILFTFQCPHAYLVATASG
jgi:hypothetical protein